MKRILSFFMCLLFVFMLGGCGNDAPASDVVGEWKGTIDYTDIALAAMSLSGDADVYFKDAVLCADTVFSFNADGSYKKAVDKAEFLAASESFMAEVKKGLGLMVADIAKEQGREQAAVDDSVIIEYFGEIPTAKEFAFAMTSVISVEGKYKTEGGKLYMADDGAIDERVYQTYKIEGDTLTITASSDAMLNETGMFPMTFKKQ